MKRIAPNRIYTFKNNNLYFVLLLVYILITSAFSKEEKIRRINCESEIIIEINKSGSHYVLNSNYGSNTYRIYINELAQDQINQNNMYEFTEDKNTIKLLFQNQITVLNSMFKECSEISKIEFKNLELSNINSMDAMFYGCSSLTSIVLSNFDTSQVTSMSNMFQSCSSLKTIKFYNFDTSKVSNMNYMFYECSELTSLDLSNFQTKSLTNVANMFQSCTSLKILILSNFDTSNVVTMDNVFYSCSSLISLDIKNFDTSKVNSYFDIFTNCRSNLIYCVNDNLNDGIKSELQKLNNNIGNDCSNACFSNNKKIIIEKNQCVTECSEDQEYILEYNSLCYKSCPKGTHKNNDNKCEEGDDGNEQYCNYEQTECFDEIPTGYYLIEDKIIGKCNEKCGTCTNECNQINLCLSCNINKGYYQKKDEVISNGFINCYNNEIDGYFLDSITLSYIQCYSTCKRCKGEGIKNQQNCIECYSNYFLNISNCL